MLKYTIQERCSLPITNSESANDDEEDWVAIREDFPSLLTGEFQEYSSNSTETSQLNKTAFKFQVDSTTDPNLYILNCRKVELSDKKSAKLQPRGKDREISQQFEVLEEQSEQLSTERIENSHKILQELFGSVKIEFEDELLLFPSFPNLSQPSSGLWSYISGSKWEPSDNCRELEEYYTSLHKFCPHEMFIEIIFSSGDQNGCSSEENKLEKYEECFSELNRNTYQSNIKKYRGKLELLEQKKQSLDIRTMDELLDFYCELDEVYYFLERALSEMFLYESQPFEYDYQISMSERDKLRDELSDPTITGELSDEDFMEICERERTGEEEVLKASARIHELTIYHIQELAQLVESQLEQSKLDKEACSSLWDKRAELRRQKIESKLDNMLINLLSVQIECLQDAKERNILSIISMEETEDFSENLKKRESIVFTIELQLIDIKLRLIAEQENMFKHRTSMLEEDKDAQQAIRTTMDSLGRKKAKLRTKQRLVKTAQAEAGQSLSSAGQKVQTYLGDSFYSELVMQKRSEANSKIAANKYDRLKREREKTIQRVRQKISDKSKDEKKLPPSYLPPSQRKGTILDTKNNKSRQQKQPQPQQQQQQQSRLRQLNITPSMAHHYPNIDSSLSKTTNSLSQQPTAAKKLQTRNIRNASRNRTTSKQQQGSKQSPKQQIDKQSPKEDTQAEVPNHRIPPPPPDIPPDIPPTADDSAKNDTSQTLKDIINARKNLPRDIESTLLPSNPHDSMMKIIRSGVKLRSVKNDKTKINPSAALSDNAHASLLKAVASISLSTQDSDSDGDHTW